MAAIIIVTIGTFPLVHINALIWVAYKIDIIEKHNKISKISSCRSDETELVESGATQS